MPHLAQRWLAFFFTSSWLSLVKGLSFSADLVFHSLNCRDGCEKKHGGSAWVGQCLLFCLIIGKNESMNNRKKGINLMCALGNGFD